MAKILNPHARAMKAKARVAGKKAAKTRAANKAKPAAKKKATGDHWFAKLSKAAQAAYIKAHPRSKYAKGAKPTAAKPAAKKAATKKPVAKNSSKTEAKVAAAQKAHDALVEKYNTHTRSPRTAVNMRTWDKKKDNLWHKLDDSSRALKRLRKETGIKAPAKPRIGKPLNTTKKVVAKKLTSTVKKRVLPKKTKNAKK